MHFPNHTNHNEKEREREREKMARLLSVCDRLKKTSTTVGLVIEESLDDVGLLGPEEQPITVEINQIQSEAPIQLLTQFIGPPPQTLAGGGQLNSSQMNDLSVERQETDKLRRAFLQHHGQSE